MSDERTMGVIRNSTVSAAARRAVNKAATEAVNNINYNDGKGTRAEGKRLREVFRRAEGAHAGGLKQSAYARKADSVADATAAGAVAAKPKPKKRRGRRAPAAGKPSIRISSDRATRSKNRRTVAKSARAKRKQFVDKIPKKYKVTRFAARAVVAGGWYLWRGTRHTAVGVGKGSAVASRAMAKNVKANARKRKWTPAAIEAKLFSSSFRCCGETFSSAEGVNKHFIDKHAGEEIQFAPPELPPAELVTATTRRHLGKVTVLLPPEHAGRRGAPRHRSIPAGRHRAGTGTDPSKRAADLVAAYRDKITEIGVRAVAENGYARTVAQGFRAWGDQRPKKLGELRENAAGLERALLDGIEALETYERYLNRPTDAGGMNIDRSVTAGPFLRAREALAQAASGLAQHIALYEDAYGTLIASQRALSTPAIDHAR